MSDFLTQSEKESSLRSIAYLISENLDLDKFQFNF